MYGCNCSNFPLCMRVCSSSFSLSVFLPFPLSCSFSYIHFCAFMYICMYLFVLHSMLIVKRGERDPMSDVYTSKDENKKKENWQETNEERMNNTCEKERKKISYSSFRFFTFSSSYSSVYFLNDCMLFRLRRELIKVTLSSVQLVA